MERWDMFGSISFISIVDIVKDFELLDLCSFDMASSKNWKWNHCQKKWQNMIFHWWIYIFLLYKTFHNFKIIVFTCNMKSCFINMKIILYIDKLNILIIWWNSLIIWWNTLIIWWNSLIIWWNSLIIWWNTLIIWWNFHIIININWCVSN